MPRFDKRYLIILPLIVFASLPLWGGKFLLSAMILVLIYIAAAEMWSFMTEHAGIVSLGQQMFVGLGGYAVAILTTYYGIPVFLSVVVAGLIGSLLAGALAFPLLRLRGLYFAIGTFLAAEIVLLFFNGWDFVGAGKGFVFRLAYDIPTSLIYYSALIISIVSILTVYFLFKSKLGYGLRAIGSEEDAAVELGVNSFKLKTYCFIIAAFITTIVGAVNCLHHAYLRPTSAFSISWTIDFLFISVIGGLGTIAGPIIGAIIYVALGYLLAGYIGLSPLLMGTISLIILMVLPGGIWGAISKSWNQIRKKGNS